VPDGELIVDTGDKLRAKRVLVGEVVSLRNAYLRNAYLRNVDLTGAYLVDADLWNAELRNAYLTDANLTGAYLVDADLGSANLTGADLTDARGNEYTVLPKGYKVVDGYVVMEAE